MSCANVQHDSELELDQSSGIVSELLLAQLSSAAVQLQGVASALDVPTSLCPPSTSIKAGQGQVQAMFVRLTHAHCAAAHSSVPMPRNHLDSRSIRLTSCLHILKTMACWAGSLDALRRGVQPGEVQGMRDHPCNHSDLRSLMLTSCLHILKTRACCAGSLDALR